MHSKNVGQVGRGRMLTTEGRPICTRAAPRRATARGTHSENG